MPRSAQDRNRSSRGREETPTAALQKAATALSKDCGKLAVWTESKGYHLIPDVTNGYTKVAPNGTLTAAKHYIRLLNQREIAWSQSQQVL